MKNIKRVTSVLLLLLMLFVMSGCVNSTYNVTLKNSGYMDVEFSVLYDATKLDEINKVFLEDVKRQFTDAGYNISAKNELGMDGIVISKKNIPPTGDKFIETAYNIDLLDDVMYNTEFKEEARCNTYKMDAKIDLTSFATQPETLKQKFTQEEYKSFLSEMNIKLVVNLEDGEITKTNSKNLSADKKSASWMLIPGGVTEVQMDATMGVNFAWTVSMIVVAIILVLMTILMITLIKMYNKRKNSND